MADIKADSKSEIVTMVQDKDSKDDTKKILQQDTKNTDDKTPSQDDKDSKDANPALDKFNQLQNEFTTHENKLVELQTQYMVTLNKNIEKLANIICDITNKSQEFLLENGETLVSYRNLTNFINSGLNNTIAVRDRQIQELQTSILSMKMRSRDDNIKNDSS